jgi:thiamine kinase-like enzyme
MPGAAEMREPQLLERTGGWMAALHALPPPAGLQAVDFGERAAACLVRVLAQAPGARIERLARELAARRSELPPPARLTACHHDLHRRNFIDDGRRLLAVDWEYAGPGDPAADIAACAGYHALDGGGVDALLGGYGGGPELRERVASLAWVFDCLWFGWNAIAALAGAELDAAEQSRLAERLAH